MRDLESETRAEPEKFLQANLALPKVGKIMSSTYNTVSPIKLETGLRPNSAGIPYALLLRIEAMGFPTFRLLL